MNIQIALLNKYFLGINQDKNFGLSLMFCNMNILYIWTPFWSQKERRLLTYNEQEIEDVLNSKSIFTLPRIKQCLEWRPNTIFTIYKF